MSYMKHLTLCIVSLRAERIGTLWYPGMTRWDAKGQIIHMFKWKYKKWESIIFKQRIILSREFGIIYNLACGRSSPLWKVSCRSLGRDTQITALLFRNKRSALYTLIPFASMSMKNSSHGGIQGLSPRAEFAKVQEKAGTWQGRLGGGRLRVGRG